MRLTVTVAMALAVSRKTNQAILLRGHHVRRLRVHDDDVRRHRRDDLHGRRGLLHDQDHDRQPQRWLTVRRG